MGFRDVDARIAGVGVVQQGGPATEPRRLLAQARTLTGGDVGHDDPGSDRSRSAGLTA
jgi:hypothetical protein